MGPQTLFLGDSAPGAGSERDPLTLRASFPALLFFTTPAGGTQSKLGFSLPQPGGCMQEWGLPSSPAL